MQKEKLIDQIKEKNSCLCVGIDPDPNKIPQHLLSHSNPVSDFTSEIVKNTKGFCVAYKPNLAFFEAHGIKGWEALDKLMHEQIPETHFTIADAKRGDLGNSSKMYAHSVFEIYDFDAVTVSPYMGIDSIEPFMDYKDKWVIVLALTSNPGSQHFQTQKMEDGRMLYQYVIDKFKDLPNVMFVVGATQGDQIKKIREQAPDNFLLIPGVGAQGGSMEDAYKNGCNEDCGVLINSSRGIIYSSSKPDFGQAAGHAASKLQKEMSTLIERYSPSLTL
ncbi:MAG: orotidine-5'-phosphate decarboxylase [Chitinophagales bacterium]|nr:orotidine-5'-phosphate decarboxylase [Chitinophagales bacterium]